MREIKFRAKRKINGDWVYGSLVRHIDEDWDTIIPEYIGDLIECDNFRVITNTIGQFTGLRDKNGKEIYEGDIIQNVADDGRRLSKFEITWKQSCCGFVKEREDGNTFTLEISRFFEVIGNIYEHKHLLQ